MKIIVWHLYKVCEYLENVMIIQDTVQLVKYFNDDNKDILKLKTIF